MFQIKNLKTGKIGFVVYRSENTVYEFTEAILKEYYCKKVINKHFNENVIMGEEEEHFYFNKVAALGFLKNLLTMMRKK